MKSESNELLENVCRTCINNDKEFVKQITYKQRKSISIFNEPEGMEFKNTTIMELLILTIPQLNIEYDDMLPKNVCESCLEKLLSAYKFQKMCISAEQKLTQMIEESALVSQTIIDPLKDSLGDISVGSIEVSEVIHDLTNLLKVEIDEPLIDQNEPSCCNKSGDENVDDIKCEIDNEQAEDASGSGDQESESDRTPYCRKKSTRTVKKFPRKISMHSKEHSSNTNKQAKTKDLKDDESKNFVCDECGNRLSTPKSLRRHKRIHLRPVIEGQRNTLAKTKHECEFCKKVFQQSSSLKDHLRTHTGEQPFLCSECGKAFKSLSNMKQHFLRHGTDRPYICPDCPKKFPCLSDLASHKAVHNKTKSHVCDVCGAAFVKPYLLKKHKMYHTGEKNHKCDYCDMRFVLADQCRRHMRTHTGEKPYKCKYCERAFAQSNDLIKHLRGHLGDNVYKCNLCPKGFRLQGDLRAHFNTHKNDDEDTKARNLKALKDEEHRLQVKFGLKCP